MTLSPGAKVQPKRSTLRSPARFNAAWSSMLSERVPTPPRFIVTDGIEAETRGDAASYQLYNASHGGFRIFGLHEVEVAVDARWLEIRHCALANTCSAWLGLFEAAGRTGQRIVAVDHPLWTAMGCPPRETFGVFIPSDNHSPTLPRKA